MSGYCECTGRNILVNCEDLPWERKPYKPQPYWLHKEHGDARWDKPDESDLKNWNEHMSASEYYYNKETGDSEWDRPTDWVEPRKGFTCAEACDATFPVEEYPAVEKEAEEEL
eukprot:Sspe_Gene.84536::Locus_55486_Transcript_2_2_Confidence_0.750_Length_889::g.84536::m.84536